MIFALITCFNANELSFVHKDGDNYMMEGEIYTPITGLRNVFNVVQPFNGLHINLKEPIPKIPLDLIFITCDHHFKIDMLNFVRKTYPNAKIVGYHKDRSPEYFMDDARRLLWDNCDAIAVASREEVVRQVSSMFPSKIVFHFPYPYDIDKLRSMYMAKTKRGALLGCTKSRNDGYTTCKDFLYEIERKYNHQALDYNESMHWDGWMRAMGYSKICLNMDTIPDIGQTAIEAAITNTWHIGGISDAAKILWPDTATNDINILDQIINDDLSNNTSSDYINYAYNKCKEEYSFKTARSNMRKITEFFGLDNDVPTITIHEDKK